MFVLRNLGNGFIHEANMPLCTVESSLALKSTNDGNRKVKVGKDQEKAQSEKDSHSKNRGGKKTN